MALAETAQALTDARVNSLTDAFNRGDVDKIMSWHSKDTKFEDPVTNSFNLNHSQLKQFYEGAYKTFSSMKIVESNAIGVTPEFGTWEMTTEGIAAEDESGLGAEKGRPLRLKGVSLLWWRWEGATPEWSGDMSTESVRGWKIVKQHDYFVPLRDQCSG